MTLVTGVHHLGVTVAAVLLAWLLAALVLTVVVATLARAGAQEDDRRVYREP